MRAAVRGTAWVGAGVLASGLAMLLAIFLWGRSMFPDNSEPLRIDSVPPLVLEALRSYYPERTTWMAARLLLYRDGQRLSQLRFNVAGTVAQLWISALWSEDEKLAEIAHGAYFGHGFSGLEAAAQGYFGLPASELSSPQVATLVFLTEAPSLFSPWCNRARLERKAQLAEGLPGTDQPDRLTEGLRDPPSDACARPAA